MKTESIIYSLLFGNIMMHSHLICTDKKEIFLTSTACVMIKTILIFLQHCVILPVAMAIVQAQTNVAVIENTAELIVLNVICKAFFTCIKHTVKPFEFVMFNFC